MKYAISSGARHLVGRLEKNDDLITALEEVCNKEHIRAGFFNAVGVLSAAELQLCDSRKYVTRFEVRHDPQHTSQTLEIVSLTGHISTVGNRSLVRAHATLSYLACGGQLHLVGGLLQRSKVLVCEYHVTFFQEVQMKYSPVPGSELFQVDFHNVAPGGAARSGARDLYTEPPSAPAKEGATEAASPWHVATEPRRMPEVFTVGNREATAEQALPTPPEPDPTPPPPPAPAAPSVPAPTANLAISPAPAEQWQVAVQLANPQPEIPTIKVGDVVKHPRFNDCLVLKFDTPHAVLVQQLEGHATHRLDLDEFSVRHIRRDSERDLFKLKALPTGVAAVVAPPLPPDNGSGLRVRPRTGRNRAADDDLDLFPTTADLVEHPKWGICAVTSADEDKDSIQLRPRQGNTQPRDVTLKAFNIVYARNEGDQKVLRLEPRDKRPSR